jgi:putative membrane protein
MQKTTVNLLKHPRNIIILIAWIYFIGVLGLALEFSRSLFQQAVPYTLLLSLIVLAVFHKSYSTRIIILSIGIFLAGFFIEVLGVATGLIFGGYAYGHTLGVKIWGTPLMIGVNWLFLSYCIWVMVSKLKWNKFLLALLGAIILVIYDVFMEPVAIWLDMWSWELVNVPIQNYLAWFVISFVFLLTISMVNPKIENKFAPALFIIQLIFFMLLNLVMIFLR